MSAASMRQQQQRHAASAAQQPARHPSPISSLCLLTTLCAGKVTNNTCESDGSSENTKYSDESSSGGARTRRCAVRAPREHTPLAVPAGTRTVALDSLLMGSQLLDTKVVVVVEANTGTSQKKRDR